MFVLNKLSESESESDRQKASLIQWNRREITIITC